jgi:hypothetical protein
VQENELGYIPVTTIYQSQKVYNGVGTTVIQDVAGIQRSIFGDSAEAYAILTYGAHPSLIVDEQTAQLNDGQVGAEPGATIQVQAGLTGEPSYVFEYVSPDLANLAEIRLGIDSKIDKLSQVAMLRSEDLIKSSNSGQHIEVYDDKLAALIRKKATNLENAESNLWNTWFDWTNQQKPADFTISYNRQYNKRAIESEMAEIRLGMDILKQYDSMFGANIPDAIKEFATEAEAVAEAERLGGSGSHSHTDDDGNITYMPFNTHDEYDAAVLALIDDEDQENNKEFKDDMRDKIRKRLRQLLDATTTENGS